MRKSLSYIFYEVSIADVSCLRRLPALTSLAQCPDNVIGIVGRQLGGNFLITTNVYVDKQLSYRPEGPRDASCQLKSCQLPRYSAETACKTSSEQIGVMKLEGYSGTCVIYMCTQP